MVEAVHYPTTVATVWLFTDTLFAGYILEYVWTSAMGRDPWWNAELVHVVYVHGVLLQSLFEEKESQLNCISLRFFEYIF